MSRSRLLTWVRVAVALLVLAVVVWGVARSWAEIFVDLRRVDATALVASTGLAAAGTWLTMLGWRVLLADLGSPLHLAPAGGVFFVGQLGKYLPGSVWTVLAQADMAARLAVPRRRTGVVGLVTIGLSVLTGVLVGLPAIPHLLRSAQSGGSVWVLLAFPVLVLACWPPLLNRVIAVGLRVLRREPLERELSTKAVVLTVVLYILAWLCFGGHTLVLARAVGGPPAPGLTVAALTGYALAGSLGMLTVILPAGLGAREGIMALVLASAMPLSGGAAVAIVSRFVITVVDVLAALAGWGYARSHHLVASRRPGRGVPAEDRGD
jgi:uncharacterized membrane protein YbhN (UPF0104 family)